MFQSKSLISIVQVSLNYYSQWLVRSAGTYPPNVWQDLWSRHDKPVFRHYHNMGFLLPAMMEILDKHDHEVLYKKEFFEHRKSKAVGQTFVQVKPVAQFADGVELRYNVGTRGNGVDRAKWPDDLSVEVVTETRPGFSVDAVAF